MSWRVGPSTTVKQLRRDACQYWGLSHADYVLKTRNLAKVQEELPIGACFR